MDPLEKKTFFGKLKAKISRKGKKEDPQRAPLAASFNYNLLASPAMNAGPDPRYTSSNVVDYNRHLPNITKGDKSGSNKPVKNVHNSFEKKQGPKPNKPPYDIRPYDSGDEPVYMYGDHRARKKAAAEKLAKKAESAPRGQAQAPEQKKGFLGRMKDAAIKRMEGEGEPGDSSDEWADGLGEYYNYRGSDPGSAKLGFRKRVMDNREYLGDKKVSKKGDKKMGQQDEVERLSSMAGSALGGTRGGLGRKYSPPLILRREQLGRWEEGEREEGGDYVPGHARRGDTYSTRGERYSAFGEGSVIGGDFERPSRGVARSERPARGAARNSNRGAAGVNSFSVSTGSSANSRTPLLGDRSSGSGQSSGGTGRSSTRASSTRGSESVSTASASDPSRGRGGRGGYGDKFAVSRQYLMGSRIRGSADKEG